ncbi:MAG: glycosyltransferase family 1 protein [Eubacteriales bacterium]|nr:glycosyltransferase family 1 protein [Eubacteriales bacterium]
MKQESIRVAQVMGMMYNGGVEAVVMNYYRAIDRSRVQFDFFVDETSAFPQRPEIEKLGGRCFLVPPYARPIRYLRALVRAFRQNGYSIVHAQINTMGVFPLFAAWLAGVPVRICHNHSTAHRGEGKKSLLKALLRPFSRLFATQCFACGDVAARWMYGDRFVNRGCATVLPNAIDLSQFLFSAEHRAAVRQEIGADRNTLVVGHIGRFLFPKNHPFLLQIFRALLTVRPNSLLMLAGEGDLYASCKALAQELGIESRVRFLGVRRDAYRLYSAMDVFCLPSFYEGLPVVMVEALANGLTCVVSDKVTRELHAYSVLQLSLDADALLWAKALSLATRSAEAPEALAHAFDIHQNAKRLQAFYIDQSCQAASQRFNPSA